MLKRRSFWIIAVLLLALAAVGVRSAVKSRQAAQAALAPAKAEAVAPVLEFLPSDLVTVTPRDLRQTLAASGSLRASNQAAVKAGADG